MNKLKVLISGLVDSSYVGTELNLREVEIKSLKDLNEENWKAYFEKLEKLAVVE